MAHTVFLKSPGNVYCPTYVSQPDGPARGAVVVLQEIFGVNAHIRAVADGYAAAGYLAVAPATFARVEADVELGYTEADMATGFGLKTQVEQLPAPGVMADIQAAIHHAGEGGLKVGIVGFCWGGLLTWRAAATLAGLSAAVPYYGGGVTAEPDASLVPQVPVLAHFGDQDRWIPLDTIEAFQHKQPQVEVHVYNAHHGFNCGQRGAYNAAAATLARERTLAFLAQHVG